MREVVISSAINLQDSLLFFVIQEKQHFFQCNIYFHKNSALTRKLAKGDTGTSLPLFVSNNYVQQDMSRHSLPLTLHKPQNQLLAEIFSLCIEYLKSFNTVNQIYSFICC